MSAEELDGYLRSLMHGEFSSLTLSWNDQNAPNYETVRAFFESAPDSDDGWVSPEERQLAFDTNSCWDLHWYPDTPIGFYSMKASSLTALMEAVSREFPVMNETGTNDRDSDITRT